MSWFDKDEQQLYIPIASSSVHFIQTPEQFYQQLLKRISTSKRRIILAALYLGTSQKEHAIVDHLQTSLDRNQDMKIGILLDYFRGTRSDPKSPDSTKRNSVDLLKPLMAFQDNIMVSLFHTPEMRGFLKNLLPERINEVIGLQHMKFFIFDDSIIISGANLSEQYFVNRQDRYMVIEDSPLLADFFHSVFDIISSHSLRFGYAGNLTFHGHPSIHPFTGSHNEIEKSIKADIEKLCDKIKDRLLDESNNASPRMGHQPLEVPNETFIFPFLQMGAFKINQEIELLNRLLDDDGNGREKEDDLEMTLMTAYFNLYDAYADLILRRCRFPIKLVFGSPQTNGFYGASGNSGQIPALYVQNVLDFMGRTMTAGRHDKIHFLEWNRPNWTFHAKGIWADSKNKMATIVGSSNFGYRSAHRDLEAQVLLVTENEALKGRIIEERNSLMEYAEAQDIGMFLRRDHLIPIWVKYFSRIFRNFF